MWAFVILSCWYYLPWGANIDFKRCKKSEQDFCEAVNSVYTHYARASLISKEPQLDFSLFCTHMKRKIFPSFTLQDISFVVCSWVVQLRSVWKTCRASIETIWSAHTEYSKTFGRIYFSKLDELTLYKEIRFVIKSTNNNNWRTT